MAELNITEILLAILDKYGLAGVAVGFCFYYVRVIEAKLDRIINLNNKTFGVMLALVDSDKRQWINSPDDSKGGSDD